MTIKVPLRDTTMRESHQWLELSREGSEYRVVLRGKSGDVGDSATAISREVLEALADVAPGVILKDGPLRFFKTEQDFRVSFTELADEEGPSGYDRLDSGEFIKAIREVLAPEKHTKKKSPSTAKKPAKKKPRAKSAKRT